jgi:WD40 repeat protein
VGVVGSAELYDPSSGTFRATGSLHTARWHAVAALLKDGSVLVAGGQDNNGTRLSSAEVYDPAAGTFAQTGSLQPALYCMSAIPMPDGSVLVLGSDESSQFRLRAETYDPTTRRFTASPPMDAVRESPTFTLLASGKVLIAGSSYRNTTLLYDTTTGTAGSTGSMTAPRWAPTATFLATGTILVAGGYDNYGKPLSSAELYDPTSGTFRSTGSLATGRAYATAIQLADGLVLIAGGLGLSGTTLALASAEVYDPAAGTFSPAGSMVSARSRATATLLPDGRVLLAGGTPASGGSTALAELYLP